MIYLHREETQRLKSAIKHVLQSRVCKDKSVLSKYASLNGTHCSIDESILVNSIIQNRQNEIGIGGTDVLTCGTYAMIENTAPKMVFINYIQASKLQSLIAKHHCPKLIDARYEVNVGDDKQMRVSVKLDRTKNDEKNVVGIEEWLGGKIGLLELSLGLKKKQTCLGKTRNMEDDLFACRDEILMV